MAEHYEQLQEYARRADEAEMILGALQAQIDYLSAVNAQSSANANSQQQSQKQQGQDIEDLILKELDEEKAVDSRSFASKYNLHPNDVYGAMNALEAEGYIAKKQKTTLPKPAVSAEGLNYIQNGSPEVQLFKILAQSADDQVSIDSIDRNNALSDDKIFTIAKNKACKNKWIQINKKANTMTKMVQLFWREISENTHNQNK